LALTSPGDSHTVELPFDASAFDPARARADTRPDVVEAQGRALWNASFAGPLGPLLDRAATRANDEGAYVALRIVPAPDLPPQLRWLPWETVFDPSRRDYLALSAGWSLVRGSDPFQESRPIPANRPHLLVVNLYGDESTRAPWASAEIAAIEGVAGDSRAVRVETRPDARRLAALLASHPAHIVHLIGRGQGEGLPLTPRDRGTGVEGDYIGGREIARAIADNPHVGLTVLSAGSSQLVAESIAQNAGVSVLGHRDTVRGEHAAALSETFYRRLFDGLPADVALTETRRALDRLFPGQRAWTSAMLLTGWPPPAVPGDGTDAGAGYDRRTALRSGVNAESLALLLHTTNRDRVRQLLGIAEWEPLAAQLREAERALNAIQAKHTP
jgi:hypothetical protein